MTRRMIQHVPARKLGSSAAASASDYAHILAILMTLHEQLPVRSLLTGVPMLLALSEAISVEDTTDPILLQRVGALQEVIARVWLTLGRTWDIPELSQLATKVCDAECFFAHTSPRYQALVPVDGASNIPDLETIDAGRYYPPRDAVAFTVEGSSKSQALPIDGRMAARMLASCNTAQDATGMDEATFFSRELLAPFMSSLF
jgi:hypothetical protein